MILFLIFAILLVLVVGAVVALAARAQAKQAVAMEDLAMKQGWTPVGMDPSTLRALLPVYLKVLAEVGSGFHPGASFSRSEETYSSAYSAAIDGHEVVFFRYDLTEYYYEDDPVTGQQHEISTTSNFLVVSADLGGDVPAIVLVHHSLLSKLASVREYKGMQPLKLEGDFNDFYDTYILPDTQDDVLELLTPDTMELLVDAAGASMEFSGRSVALSLEGKPVAPDVIVPLLANLRALIGNIQAKPETRQRVPEATP